MQYIFPTAYCPPISWLALFLVSDNPLLEIHESFPKQTIRNRCFIMAANGKLRLSVPVKRPLGNKTLTAEILIDHSTHWHRQHYRSLTSAYSNTPYFSHYKEEISCLLFSEQTSLIQYNSAFINLILKMLKTEKRWNYTETFYRDAVNMSGLIRFEQCMKESVIQLPVYPQAFSERLGFLPDLSVLDLIFNLGPVESLQYLLRVGAELMHK